MVVLRFGPRTEAQNKVSGTVGAPDGTLVAGVTGVIERICVGTTTNAEGNYTLKEVPADAAQVLQFIGMENQTEPVAGKTVIDVTMTDDTVGMDAVVVTASGMTRAEKTLG